MVCGSEKNDDFISRFIHGTTISAFFNSAFRKAFLHEITITIYHIIQRTKHA